MTSIATGAPHAALHSLAARTGCRCPQCGGGRARFDEFDEIDELHGFEAFDEFDEFEGFDETDEVDEASDEVFRALGGIASAVGGIGRVAGSLGGVARAVGGIGRAAGSLGGVARGLGGLGRAAGAVRGVGGIGRIAGQFGRAGRGAAALARAGGRGGQVARLARAGRSPAARQLVRAARQNAGAQQQAPQRNRTAAQMQARLQQILQGRAGRPGAQPAPRRIGPAPRTTPQMQAAMQQVLQASGHQWQQNWGQANMQQLANFQAAGGVRQDRSGHLQLTPQGRRMLRAGGAHANLGPMFRAHSGRQDIYRMQMPGQQLYVGKTGRPTGLRLLEHLNEPSGPGPQLRQMAAQGQLDQIGLDHSMLGNDVQPHTAHMVEGAVIQTEQPLWNDARKHGFEF